MILVITSSFDKTIDYIVKKHSINNFYRFEILIVIVIYITYAMISAFIVCG